MATLSYSKLRTRKLIRAKNGKVIASVSLLPKDTVKKKPIEGLKMSDVKTINDIPAIFRTPKPEYVNNSLHQLFFDRERYVQQMLLFRELVATSEMVF